MSSAHHRTIIEMIADGNCLFRAMSYCVSGNQEHHHTIRQQIVRYVTTNWEQFENFLTPDFFNSQAVNMITYANIMCEDGVHGGNLEIYAFTKVYKSRLRIHVNNINSQVYSFGDFGPEFSLLYRGDGQNGHYDVLFYHDDGNPNGADDLQNQVGKKVRNRDKQPLLPKSNKRKHGTSDKTSDTDRYRSDIGDDKGAVVDVCNEIGLQITVLSLCIMKIILSFLINKRGN